MTIPSQMARVILNEHKFKPLTGKILTIGRQTVTMSPNEALQLIAEEGVSLRANVTTQLDSVTRYGNGMGFIDDVSFFKLFCDASVQALDVSKYEQADIVCNLNEPLPTHLAGQFDFIFNGSCLDNIFDPATSIKNMSRLLKPGGRIIHFECGTPINGPYLVYSVEWFFNYYAINNFEDCKTYLAHFSNLERPWDIYAWDPVSIERHRHWKIHWSTRAPLKLDYMIITVAEKGPASTCDKVPIQWKYKSKSRQRLLEESAERFWSSQRPFLGQLDGETHKPYYRNRPLVMLFLSAAKRFTKKWLGRVMKERMPVIPRPPRFIPFTFCRTLY